MENQRNFILAIALSALVLIGWSAISAVWFPLPKAPPTKSAPATATATAPVNGAAPGVAPAARIQDRAKVLAASPRVAIRTPSLTGSINLTGARIDDLVLLRHRETLDKKSPPVRLLSPAGTQHAYYAGFGWTGEGLAAPAPTSVWTADGSELTPQRPVTLTTANANGQVFTLRFTVDDNYLFNIEQTVTNKGLAPVAAQTFAFIGRDGKSVDLDQWTAHVGPLGVFNDAANYDVNWETLDSAGTAGTRFKTDNGWLGFGDKYWLTALAPGQGRAPRHRLS